MNRDALALLWSNAAQHDRTLRGTAAHLDALARKRIAPKPFDRATLFDAVARTQPALFTGVPVRVAGQQRLGLVTALTRALARGFGDGPCARAQTGPSRTRRMLSAAELMRRWGSGRHVVGVTDLHVRGTPLMRQIDTRALSAFNLLPRGSAAMRRQEMLTLVVATAGNVTDSHSDDPDGSNHCFVGRKLWLAWDTFEGQAAGLQDCERQAVNGRARFRIDTFCGLPSARWWTVEDGQTLFLPGRFTHKVITLAPYLGIGSFYVTPASCLDSLTRWFVHGPLWTQADPDDPEITALADTIAAVMQTRAAALGSAHRAERAEWGFDHAALGERVWRQRWPREVRQRMCQAHPSLPLLAAHLKAAAAIS